MHASRFRELFARSKFERVNVNSQWSSWDPPHWVARTRSGNTRACVSAPPAPGWSASRSRRGWPALECRCYQTWTTILLPLVRSSRPSGRCVSHCLGNRSSLYCSVCPSPRTQSRVIFIIVVLKLKMTSILRSLTKYACQRDRRIKKEKEFPKNILIGMDFNIVCGQTVNSLPSALSSPCAWQHTGTQARRIQASCPLSDTSSAYIPGTCAACTCQSRNCSRIYTGTPRSSWCCAGRSPCNPRRSTRCNGTRRHGHHTPGTAPPAASGSALFSSWRHSRRCHHPRRLLRLLHLRLRRFHSRSKIQAATARPYLHAQIFKNVLKTSLLLWDFDNVWPTNEKFDFSVRFFRFLGADIRRGLLWQFWSLFLCNFSIA